MRRVHWLLVILPLLAVAASPRTAWCQAGSAPIVAVFNIEPVGLRLPQDTIERLSVFLNGHVAATGRFQVVPRDQLKARLVEQKKASYRQCYDQSCQIDLGKELAAQKSLASQVVKVGSRCMVSMTLFDLGRAASEAAATIQGKCDEDALADSHPCADPSP